MRRRGWLALALALLLGALTFELLAARRGRGPAVPGPEAERSNEGSPVLAARPDSAAAVEPAPGRRLVTGLPQVSEALASPSKVLLAGRWIVHDEHGATHAFEDGWFEYTVDGTGPTLRADVRGGLWSVDRPPGAGLCPGRIELGGRSAVAFDSAWERLAEPNGETPIDVEARWLRPIVLRVLDAQSRTDLDGVDVLIGGEGRSVLCPIGGVRICTDARSPVELPLPESLDGFENTERVWARARGYGWASMEIPRGLGGEFVLALRGCGTLTVEVNGVVAPLSPFFRLRDTAFEPADWQGVLYEQHLVADARFELDSIPAGAYLATIEVGHAMRHPRILDERDVLVQAGIDQQVKFDVASFPRPALVEVRGVLVVPVEWELGNMGLYLELVGEPTLDGVVQRYLDQSEMDVLDPGLASFAWSFGELQPGSYEARFNPLGTSFAFEAPATSRIHLEVPPPATLEVSVVNDRTGQLVLDARVSWMPSREDLESGGALNGAGLIEPGRFSLRSPAGEVEIWCWSKTHRFQREILTLAPGHQQFELRMSLAEGITLSILDGESALPLREVELDIREIDGDGEGWLMDDEHYATEGHCVVTHPGLYRIEVTRMPASYQLPPSADVMVPEATFVPVSLQSRR